MVTNTFDDLARTIAKEIKKNSFGKPESLASTTSWDNIPQGRLFTINHTTQSDSDQRNAPGPGRWLGFTSELVTSYKIQIAWITSVTPNVRMVYRAWASSTGWASWVEIGGSSAFYDSGLRDITSLVTTPSDWDMSRLSIKAQRVGGHVDLFISSIIYQGSDTGQVALCTMPSGWRPPASVYGNTMRNNSTYQTNSGLIRITNPAAILDYAHMSYVTRDSIPTVPFGTNG